MTEALHTQMIIKQAIIWISALIILILVLQISAI